MKINLPFSFLPFIDPDLWLFGLFIFRFIVPVMKLLPLSRINLDPRGYQTASLVKWPPNWSHRALKNFPGKNTPSVLNQEILLLVSAVDRIGLQK